VPLACPVKDEPVCMTTGDCQPCNGDFASGTTQACQLLGNPHCFQSAGPSGETVGECGKCQSDADCTADTHNGPKCNVVAGVCGTACNSDTDCKATEWCGQNVCIPKTPNAQPVTSVPPFVGERTDVSGPRTCIASVCEPSDDLCGLKNGSPCDETKSTQCRSNICFAKDDRCGLPAGEPCTGNGQCRSEECKNGVCTGCDDDTDCPLGQICDGNTKQCIAGCRPSAADGGADGGAHGLCPDPANQDCVPRDGAPDVGDCVPKHGADAGDGDGGTGGDAGDTFGAGLVEGGGCSCRTTVAAASPPFALFAAAVAAFLAARRRRHGR
jgi:MYXO-CTERM domain-containing protein